MTSRSLHRRAFAQQLAVSALAPAVVLPVAVAAADEPEAKESKTNVEAPEPEAPPVEPSQLVLQLIERQYPADLTGEQRAEILGQIERQLVRSRILSGLALKNGDEPAPSFSAWRAD